MYLNGVNKQEGGKELRLIRTWDVFKLNISEYKADKLFD